MKKKLKNYFLTFLKGWGYSLAVALILTTSIKSAIADFNDVPTGSMEPTILKGDRVFINKLSYDLKIPYTTIHILKWDNPDRGDIVVFYSPMDEKRLIKRVLGVAGDTLSMHENRLLINGEPILYDRMEKSPEDSDTTCEVIDRCYYFSESLKDKKHIVKFIKNTNSLDSFQTITIPENSYFMLGDNRDNSADSRYFGFVERHRIVGKANCVVASRKGSFLHPRWNRFFTQIF